jgi:hypothetical protein
MGFADRVGFEVHHEYPVLSVKIVLPIVDLVTAAGLHYSVGIITLF